MRIDIVSQYHDVVDMVPYFGTIWSTSESLIAALPSSIVSTSRAPALLKLIHSLSQHDKTYTLVASRVDAVQGVFQCVAMQHVDFSIVRLIMDILHSFLNHDDGKIIKQNAEVCVLDS